MGFVADALWETLDSVQQRSELLAGGQSQLLLVSRGQVRHPTAYGCAGPLWVPDTAYGQGVQPRCSEAAGAGLCFTQSIPCPESWRLSQERREGNAPRDGLGTAGGSRSQPAQLPPSLASLR